MSSARPVIMGPRVVLRGPEPRDVASIRRIPHDPQIAAMFGASGVTGRERTAAEAEAFYARMAADLNPHHWVVDVGGWFVGTAKLYLRSEADQRVRYAVGILSRPHIGRGLGTETTQLVLSYAFGVLGQHRVEARVLAVNARAISCYQACGFVIEGREREAARYAAGWSDMLIMGVLEREYRQISLQWPRVAPITQQPVRWPAGSPPPEGVLR